MCSKSVLRKLDGLHSLKLIDIQENKLNINSTASFINNSLKLGQDFFSKVLYNLK